MTGVDFLFFIFLVFNFYIQVIDELQVDQRVCELSFSPQNVRQVKGYYSMGKNSM